MEAVSIEQGVEEVTVPAEDDTPMKTHIVCGGCYPDENNIPIGTPAMCGEKVLGIKPLPNEPVCRACIKAKFPHYMQVHTPRWGR